MDPHATGELTMASHASHHHAPPVPAHLKRKRSPSHEIHHSSAPLPKTAKTHNHLQINYLARHLDDDLPLITNDDTLPNILSLLGDYQGVLDRHESMACNLGARPLGPILIKRFERLFDGPPRVLKSHGKDGTTVTWLDVVEFARNKPEQFQLGQMSEGVRVCQFYTKQCRVQISEEDFVLISSGIPQKMIPPQPIIEDEEKELGTIEILEKNLGQICQLADQGEFRTVSSSLAYMYLKSHEMFAARTRQLNHRLKGRKQAILDRRTTASPVPPVPRPSSPSNVALMNGGNPNPTPPNPPNLGHMPPSQASPSGGGFVAVNARHHESNGHGTSSTTRHELLSKFHTMSERRPSSQPPNGTIELSRRPSISAPHVISHPSTPVNNPSRAPPQAAEVPPPIVARTSHLNESELHSMMNSPVPIPNTPSNLLPANSQRASQPQEKDDGGPFKAEMVHRMESLAKGERILPPCDRCRRLHMDCLKNLTACMGCTKKHAKCSWKEVREGELRGSFSYPPATNSNPHSETSDLDSGDRASTGSPAAMLSPPRHGLTPSHIPPPNNRQHTPLQHHPAHERPDVTAQQPPPHYELPHDARIPPTRNSPLDMDRERERERERNADVTLQEATQIGLAAQAHAHVNARIAGSDGKSTTEYQPQNQNQPPNQNPSQGQNQTMVA
ncbi:Nn.00g007060.m01.CDS01 [Neocucurbitaria sp. VM-36]